MKIEQLLSFIDASPTAFHAVKTIQSELESEKTIVLDESDTWKLEENKLYSVTRDDASIIIFKTPKKINVNSSFRMIGAHTDSPCLKVKSNPTSTREGYQLLNIEVYGGVLLSSWFDKDLLIGGRVFTEDKAGNLTKHLIKLPYKIRIPRLAIHLDRKVNSEGFKVNAQTQLIPVMGLGENIDFSALIQQQLKTKEAVLSWDLFLFDSEPSSLGGLQKEFVYAPRLDNLGSVHASLSALLASATSTDKFQVAAYFHNEEIGSNTQNGAGSNFLHSVLERICSVTAVDSFAQSMARSFFISADMAHAIHPNYTEAHDANHKPRLNQGPVIKSNANMRYATDGLTIAKFKQWCHQSKTAYQDFCTRNDMGCGSTIGPMTAAKLGVPTIDIGNPMLSMHSIREMAGTEDHKLLVNVFKTFYSA
ncbi:MAG: M18 family aminopeptidase [Cyclobacteriaceae bacterium]